MKPIASTAKSQESHTSLAIQQQNGAQKVSLENSQQLWPYEAQNSTKSNGSDILVCVKHITSRFFSTFCF